MDNIFKILLYLAKHNEQAFTMHELSKLTKIPYATLYRLVNKLGSLIIKKKVGKAVTIQLNKEADLSLYYLVIASSNESHDFIRDKPIFNLIRGDCASNNFTILLFGSHAKQTTTGRSDVDILVIRKGKHPKKEPLFKKYEILFKKDINPIYITQNEFKLMLKDKEENVGKQALKDHIILTNPALFWNTVKETWN